MFEFIVSWYSRFSYGLDSLHGGTAGFLYDPNPHVAKESSLWHGLGCSRHDIGCHHCAIPRLPSVKHRFIYAVESPGKHVFYQLTVFAAGSPGVYRL